MSVARKTGERHGADVPEAENAYPPRNDSFAALRNTGLSEIRLVDREFG